MDLKSALENLQKNPELFFEKVLGVETLEEYQREVIRTVAANERTAVAACHDLGKSFLMARIVLWFASCFPYSKVITTAPTYNQVKNILWSEIRSAHSRAKLPLGGKLNLTDWQLSREGDWFAIGFTPKNEVQSGEGQGTQSSFQGFHAPYLMVVFDEATGIPPGVWTMAEGLLTSANVKFVAIGNPTSRNSEFFRCFKSPAWSKVNLSCFNSPNLQANGLTDMAKIEAELETLKSMLDGEAQARMARYVAPKPYLLSAKWVMASIIKWGLKHPLTVSKIFGQFPEEGDDALMPLGIIEEAQRREYEVKESDRKTIGVDVARFGSDSTVIHAMHGRKVIKKKTMSKRDTVAVTGEVLALERDLGGVNVIVVDETGLGSGVVDMLNEAKRDGKTKAEIRGVQFGAAVECDGPKDCDHKDCDKARYANVKAKMFGLLGDDLKRQDGIALLDEAIYLEELPSILYGFDSKGRMVIESKDDYKKRTGRGSPDTADSLALANYGHYRTLSVGSFTGSSFYDFAPPLAASIGALRKW
jgi:hypothetical protein